ncbi:MAG: hypothetical protein EXQ96_10275 [Alphaproteobacteria bacterium]|nr:hypothetical protein [Alphaproteobacteria bacterium]
MSSQLFQTPAATLLGRYDRDHYWAALFAPAPARAAFIAVSAFAVELALVRERVSQPTLGLLRLQWWREAVERLFRGAVPNEPVAVALAGAIADRDLPRAAIERMIAAREQEIAQERPADLEGLVAHVAATAGEAAVLRLAALGVTAPVAVAAARDGGTAYGLAGTLRAAAFNARRGRTTLPFADATEDLWRDSGRPRLAALAKPVATRAHVLLDEARRAVPRPDRGSLAAFLSAALAAADLARLARRGHDLLAPDLSGPPLARLLRLASAAAMRRY